MVLGGDRPDLMMVGYFPPTGAIAELFATIASGLAQRVSVGVLAPRYLETLPGVQADFRFPYSTRRPDRAVTGQGWRAHRAAAATQPRVTLLFTQHPLNAVSAGLFRSSRLALWWHEPVARGQASALRRTMYGLNDRLVVPRCDRFVVASDSVRASVPGRYRDRTIVVPFPSPASPGVASKRFSLSPTDLVFFGKLETYKGLDTLADALELLEARDLHPTVRIVGSGRLADAAPRLARFGGRHPGRVDHVDEYAPGADVASALRCAGVCVLPYLTAAGSSAIAVAGQQRAALVASCAGSFGDFLTDGVTARLHRPGDAEQLADLVVDLLGDPIERTRLGEALHELQATRFSIEATSRALLAGLLDGWSATRP